MKPDFPPVTAGGTAVCGKITRSTTAPTSTRPTSTRCTPSRCSHRTVSSGSTTAGHRSGPPTRPPSLHHSRNRGCLHPSPATMFRDEGQDSFLGVVYNRAFGGGNKLQCVVVLGVFFFFFGEVSSEVRGFLGCFVGGGIRRPLRHSVQSASATRVPHGRPVRTYQPEFKTDEQFKFTGIACLDKLRGASK